MNRRLPTGLLALGLALGAAACDDSAGSNPDAGPTGPSVTGAWCGLDVAAAADCTGDEVVYVELTQSGAAVTGRACEQYLVGCYDLENGSRAGNTLTYRYTFAPDHVDATFTESADGKTLTGTYASTKCTCDLPETLHRLAQ